jgi:hypothetical protein
MINPFEAKDLNTAIKRIQHRIDVNWNIIEKHGDVLRNDGRRVSERIAELESILAEHKKRSIQMTRTGQAIALLAFGLFLQLLSVIIGLI